MSDEQAPWPEAPVDPAADDPLEHIRGMFDVLLRDAVRYGDQFVTSLAAEQLRVLLRARADANTIITAARAEAEREREHGRRDAERQREAARLALADVRACLAEMEAFRLQLSSHAEQLHDLGATRRAADESEVNGYQADAEPAAGDDRPLPPAAVEVFLRDLAEQLSSIDRARHEGDRDLLATTLRELSACASSVHAEEIIRRAEHLGSDATPEELDDLIRCCYGVRSELVAAAGSTLSGHYTAEAGGMNR